MMELSVVSTSITEPITVSELKTFLGYPADTSQDALMEGMITAARQWLEGRTALSFVEKDYKAYFEKDDADSEGYYELPISPVTSSDAEIIVSVTGTATTFQIKGLNIKRIKPDNVIGTISVGGSSQYYVTVEFSAGADNTGANEIIKQIAGIMFTNRSLNFSEAWLPYNTRKQIEGMSVNV